MTQDAFIFCTPEQYPEVGKMLSALGVKEVEEVALRKWLPCDNGVSVCQGEYMPNTATFNPELMLTVDELREEYF
jgi:hypothetical protein